MKAGRKNLKRAMEEKIVSLEQGQSIMQVVELRGSNLIEVMDAKGVKLLALFPAKFQKSMWMKRGNFVVIDESGREDAVESGRKVVGMVTQVLHHEQVRALKKSLNWPEVFKSTKAESAGRDRQSCSPQKESASSDDEGLPPLEPNENRRNPLFSHTDMAADSDSDS